jgi:hypothetical protein
MQKEKSNFFVTSNKYLAYGLSFLGFSFYKFDGKEGVTTYSFKRTSSFQEVFDELHRLKRQHINEKD